MDHPQQSPPKTDQQKIQFFGILRAILRSLDWVDHLDSLRFLVPLISEYCMIPIVELEKLVSEGEDNWLTYCE